MKNKKIRFYVAEVPGINVYGKATEIHATSLTSAKRTASRMKCFCGTVLYIGFTVNSDGFILEPIARKKEGEKWVDIFDPDDCNYGYNYGC